MPELDMQHEHPHPVKMVGHSPWKMIILLLVIGCIAGYFFFIRTDPWQKKAEPAPPPAATKTAP